MTDQCKHCVNRGNITACKSVQCRHHDDWYPMTLQTEINALVEMLAQGIALQTSSVRLRDVPKWVTEAFELISKHRG